jgi:hypothetical protein
MIYARSMNINPSICNLYRVLILHAVYRCMKIPCAVQVAPENYTPAVNRLVDRLFNRQNGLE